MKPSLVVVASLALACGGPKQPEYNSSRVVAPAILRHVPADTPYFFGMLEPLGDKLRRRVFAGTEQGLQQALDATMNLSRGERADLDPWLRAALAVLDRLRGKPATEWLAELGFTRDGRVVLYGLGVWPVVRVEVADPVKLRGVIEHALATGGVAVPQSTSGGRPYWHLALGKLEVVVAVLDRELVMALVPARALAGVLPELLAIRDPERSLATTTTLADLAARHHLTMTGLAFVDARALVHVLTREPTELDVFVHEAMGPLGGACKADLERLAAVVPRTVFGYRRLDEHALDMAIVVETRALAGLAGARTAVPGVTTVLDHQPLFALGVAARSDELLAWLADVGRAIQARPFQCAWLHGLNDAGAWLVSTTGSSVPKPVQGLQGLAIVVDDVQITPPRLVGDVLLVGEHVYDVLPLLNQTVPVLGGLPVADGTPVAVPSPGIPWLDSIHLATKGDRLAIAVGPDSERRVVDRLAMAPPNHSPLAIMAVDGPRLQKVLDAMGRGADQSSRMRDVGKVVMRLDADASSLTFGMAGTWAPLTSPR